jgi:dTDP-glucose 4,6-dehydratase/UDP-glucose 4-epimerase
LRVFSAYGPRLKKQLFWDLYQKSLQSDVISLFGTGSETRDFIYIDDLLHILDLVIQNSSFQGSIYNVASAVETTIAGAAQIFIGAFSPEKKLEFTGEVKEGDPIHWLADMEFLSSKGFNPQFDLHLGLKKYAEWLKENA